MKKTILMTAMAALLLTGCKIERNVSRSLTMTESNYNPGRFVAIDVTGSPSVWYYQSDSLKVRVKGPEDLVDDVVVTKANGRLKIGMKDGIKLIDWGDTDDMIVEVWSPDLTDVTLTGSGGFKCRTDLDTDTLRLMVKGSGDMEFGNIVCDRLDVELTGSGDIDVKDARTQLASLYVKGSGDMEVRLQNTRQTNISLLGSGDIDVDFGNCQQADCSLRGSGDIELSGFLEHYSEQISGSGDIEKRNLTIRN